MAFKRSTVRSRSAPPKEQGLWYRYSPFNFWLMSYFVYVLKSESKGSSYVGHTQDLDKRIEEHNNGKSKSTRHKRPWILVYSEKYETRSNAVHRERYFKTVKGRIELKKKGII